MLYGALIVSLVSHCRIHMQVQQSLHDLLDLREFTYMSTVGVEHYERIVSQLEDIFIETKSLGSDKHISHMSLEADSTL